MIRVLLDTDHVSLHERGHLKARRLVPLETKDTPQCPGHFFHMCIIYMAKHTDDTAFIDHPNLLA